MQNNIRFYLSIVSPRPGNSLSAQVPHTGKSTQIRLKKLQISGNLIPPIYFHKPISKIAYFLKIYVFIMHCRRIIIYS